MATNEYGKCRTDNPLAQRRKINRSLKAYKRGRKSAFCDGKMNQIEEK